MLGSVCFPPCFLTFISLSNPYSPFKIRIFKLDSFWEYLFNWTLLLQYGKKLFINITISICSHCIATAEAYTTAAAQISAALSYQECQLSVYKFSDIIHFCIWSNIAYRIPGIFRGMYISRLSMKQGFLRLKFRGWRLSKNFHVFRALLQGYVWKMYATNLSEIDISQSRQS